jgi:hypothetical protein
LIERKLTFSRDGQDRTEEATDEHTSRVSLKLGNVSTDELDRRYRLASLALAWAVTSRWELQTPN